jgi:putative redox protein
MRLLLESESSLVLDEGAKPGLAIEPAGPDVQFSPFHMLAASLASCTYSVLYGWAVQADLEFEDLRLRVSWRFAEGPLRVGDLELTIDWPSLPQPRRPAAARAAELCTIHATLMHPPTISVRTE